MKLLFFVALLWAMLAIIFAFTDLQISMAFANPNSRWGNFLADWGRYPGYITLLVALCIGAFRILSMSVFSLLGHKKKRGYRKTVIVSSQAMMFAKVTIGVAFLNALFVNVTKYVWGRVRFYDLDALFSQYTPWYLPQGSNGHRSFMSGDAALGWLLLPIVILFLDRNRATRISITALAIGWGTAVAIGRVRVGAHYASDVLFSTGVAIIACLLLYQYFSSRARSARRVDTEIAKTGTRPEGVGLGSAKRA